LKVQAVGVQLPRKQSRIGFAPFKHEAIRQTVAENKNGFYWRGMEALSVQDRTGHA
jgi:hypothetical protein